MLECFVLTGRKPRRLDRDESAPIALTQTVSIIVSSEDRARLAGIIGDRNSLQKHVQRARVILHSVEHLPIVDVARQAGVSRPAVWRWQRWPRPFGQFGG